MPNPLKLDPTRTLTIRKKFVAAVNRRYNKLWKAIKDLIVTEDAFGLDQPDDLLAVFNTRFQFESDAGKITAFRKWLKEQIDAGILEVDDITRDPWLNEFIHSAYKKGATRGYVETNKAGLISDQFFQGKKDQFLLSAFSQPETLAKIELIYTRAYSNLQGISDAMSADLSRTLADGLTRGEHPRVIARQIQKRLNVSKTRARTLARTEVIHAHSEGQLDSMESLGVDKIEAMVEWSTADDDRVCEQCSSLQGVVMTIKEARGIIPRHPNCRCTWLPANIGEDTKGQKRSKGSIDVAIKKSIKAGAKKKATLKQARAASTWPGADLKVKKTRPVANRSRVHQLR